MTDQEFTTVLATLRQLWPKAFAAEFNGEQGIVWKMAVGKFSAGETIAALRDHAAGTRWPARPADIAARIRARAMNNPQASGDHWAAHDADQREQAECAQQRREVMDAIATLSNAELRRHVRRIVAGYRWPHFLARRDPRKSLGMAAMVCERLRANMDGKDRRAFTATREKDQNGNYQTKVEEVVIDVAALKWARDVIHGRGVKPSPMADALAGAAL